MSDPKVVAEAAAHLRKAIVGKLELWNEAGKAEKLLDLEIDTGDIDYFCSGLDDAEQVQALDDAAILAVFELNPDGTQMTAEQERAR